MTDRRCQYCGEVLRHLRKDARYCNTTCRREAARARKGVSGPEAVNAFPWSELSARAATLRQTRSKTAAGTARRCAREGCDNPIYWRRSDAMYCSAGCRRRAQRAGQDQREQRQVRSGVYFIGGAGLIKIGISDNVDYRLLCLQRMSPVPLELLAVIETASRHQVEEKLHRQFHGQRHHGEWFESSDELHELVATHAEQKAAA